MKTEGCEGQLSFVHGHLVFM